MNKAQINLTSVLIGAFIIFVLATIIALAFKYNMLDSILSYSFILVILVVGIACLFFVGYLFLFWVKTKNKRDAFKDSLLKMKKIAIASCPDNLRNRKIELLGDRYISGIDLGRIKGFMRISNDAFDKTLSTMKSLLQKIEEEYTIKEHALNRLTKQMSEMRKIYEMRKHDDSFNVNDYQTQENTLTKKIAIGEFKLKKLAKEIKKTQKQIAELESNDMLKWLNIVYYIPINYIKNPLFMLPFFSHFAKVDNIVFTDRDIWNESYENGEINYITLSGDIRLKGTSIINKGSFNWINTIDSSTRIMSLNNITIEEIIMSVFSNLNKIVDNALELDSSHRKAIDLRDALPVTSMPGSKPPFLGMGGIK